MYSVVGGSRLGRRPCSPFVRVPWQLKRCFPIAGGVGCLAGGCGCGCVLVDFSLVAGTPPLHNGGREKTIICGDIEQYSKPQTVSMTSLSQFGTSNGVLQLHCPHEGLISPALFKRAIPATVLTSRFR